MFAIVIYKSNLNDDFSIHEFLKSQLEIFSKIKHYIKKIQLFPPYILIQINDLLANDENNIHLFDTLTAKI